jgi:hypothetical protein
LIFYFFCPILILEVPGAVHFWSFFEKPFKRPGFLFYSHSIISKYFSYNPKASLCCGCGAIIPLLVQLVQFPLTGAIGAIILVFEAI